MEKSPKRHIQHSDKMMARILDWIRRNYAISVSALLVLLFSDVVVDPENLIFHGKYVLFILVLAVGLLNLILRKESLSKQFWFILVFISLFMPFYALSVGILRGALQNTTVGDMVYFNSFFFFLLMLVATDKRIVLPRIFNTAALLVVLLTLGFYLILIWDTSLFGDLYNYFVVDKRVALYAIRTYDQITALMIYYKTSPLLVFPLSYYLYQIFIERKKRSPVSHYLLFVLIAVTLVLSGTRANLFALVFIFLFYIGFYIYRKSRLWFVLVGSFFILSFLLIFPVLFQLFLNPQEASNVVKYGYLSSYADFFNQNVLTLVFGQGIGGVFYTTSLHRLTNVTELAYFELIRIWGIPVSTIFVLILIWPLVKEIKAGKLSHLFIAYLAYLFIAGTNPLLLSSTGMLVIVYVFSMGFADSKGLKLQSQEKYQSQTK